MRARQVRRRRIRGPRSSVRTTGMQLSRLHPEARLHPQGFQIRTRRRIGLHPATRRSAPRTRHQFIEPLQPGIHAQGRGGAHDLELHPAACTIASRRVVGKFEPGDLVPGDAPARRREPQAFVVGRDPGPLPSYHAKPMDREAKTQQTENPDGNDRQVENDQRRQRQGEPTSGHQRVRNHRGRRIAVFRHARIVASRAVRRTGAWSRSTPCQVASSATGLDSMGLAPLVHRMIPRHSVASRADHRLRTAPGQARGAVLRRVLLRPDSCLPGASRPIHRTARERRADAHCRVLDQCGRAGAVELPAMVHLYRTRPTPPQTSAPRALRAAIIGSR